MLLLPQNFLTALEAGEIPVLYTFLSSHMGYRVYGMKSPPPNHMSSTQGLLIYDGTIKIGTGILFGSTSLILDWGAKLLDAGTLRETLAPEGDNLLASFLGTELDKVSPSYDNSDGHFDDVLGEESFLTQKIQYKIGFPSLNYHDFITVFSGTIKKETLTETQLKLIAHRV